MRFSILLGLAFMALSSAPLFGQEPEKVRHLYFTKTYRGTDPLPQIVTVTGANSGVEFTPSARTSAGGEWLSISPSLACCITPSPLTVSVKPDLKLAPGNYSGQVVLIESASSQVIDVDLIVTPPHVPTFDRTPSQLSFSVEAGGEVPPQMMQINSVGQGSLSWAVIPSSNFLKVSVESGTAPTRISIGIIRDNLPGAGRTSGVYTGHLLFVSANSTTTIPVTVEVGDTELRWSHRLKAMKAAGEFTSSPPAGGNPNLWPANTANCFCGHFNNQDTGYGGFALAPDGTNSGKQVVEANPGSGSVPHYEVLYQDLGAGPQTISFYLKPDIDNWAYLTSQVDGVVHSIWFNLSTGTPGNNAIPSGWVVHTPVLWNGWYRYAVSFNAVSSAVNNGFGLATADQQYAFVATSGHGVFEWGQQAEHASAPSAYQSNDAPCMGATVQRDSGLVPAGATMGFTISTANQATPSNATTLNAPLPGGPGINWSISPAFGGPGTCAITGPVNSQTLACDFSVLAPGTGAAVHIASGTTSSSCGVYGTTATVTAGGVLFQSNDSITVQCAGPVLSITKTHSGSFAQGQTGAIYTVVVSNSSAPTSGTVSVAETIPVGLTLVSMGGTGWSCPPAGTTCSRNDSLGIAASYEPITVTVNVSLSAPSSVTNVVTVSGGGDTVNHSANDPTTIVSQALRFVPVVPCRVADTRNPNGPFGGPAIAGGGTRDFSLTASTCGIPSNAVSYLLNVTVVPPGSLGFVTVWPSGQAQPTVSTLNSQDGRIKANAAIVPAGANGAISVFASSPTNVIVDINGYFVPATVAQSLAFYPVTPCRLADTRNATGTFGGPSMIAGATRNFPVLSGSCGIPATAQAFVINMTVVPNGPLGFLTTWRTGTPQPLASTLNALTGAITSNLAVVPAGTGGAIAVYVSDRTDLVMDITGYFAPPGTGSLDFYSVSPCRVLDTRGAAGPLGGPSMPGGASRAFPVPSSSCSIPATAKAYSMNATVVPPAPLGFLTLWGSGAMPLASTLNSLDASIVANAVLVPAGTNGVVTAYTTEASQLILDINGFFQ